MSYKQRFEKYKQDRNIDNDYISSITGNTPESIRVVTSSNKTFPRWLKLAIHQHELDKKIIKESLTTTSCCSKLCLKYDKKTQIELLSKLAEDLEKKQIKCDVCGSEDIIEAPHMGRNCSDCNPL